MSQRRMPSGQGPTRRSAQAGRTGRRSGGRSVGRDSSARNEPRNSAARAAPTLAAGAGRGAEPSRSGSRPAAARRAAAGGAAKRTVAPRPQAFTGRAVVLLVVLVALAMAYTYPVRTYLAQESEIGRVEAALAAQQARIAGKQQEIEKWQDPQYVKAEARRRLYWGEPGEVLLVVGEDPEGAARDSGRPPAGTSPTPDRWYDTLWSSIAAANAQSRP